LGYNGFSTEKDFDMEKIVLIGVILVALLGFSLKRRATFLLGLGFLVCGVGPFLVLYGYEAILHPEGIATELSMLRSLTPALFLPFGLLLTFFGFLKHE